MTSVFGLFVHLHWRSSGFPTKLNTNWAVKPQKIARVMNTPLHPTFIVENWGLPGYTLFLL